MSASAHAKKALSTEQLTARQLMIELSTLFGRTAMLARPAEDDGLALTVTQRLAVLELSTSEPLRLHELAARIGTSAPTASRVVDALLEAGLAERVPDPDDRRAVQIRLSDAGRTRIAERMAVVAGALEPAFATLDAGEREQLLTLLSRLNSALR